MHSALRYQTYGLVKNIPKWSLFSFKSQIMGQIKIKKEFNTENLQILPQILACEPGALWLVQVTIALFLNG